MEWLSSTESSPRLPLPPRTSTNALVMDADADIAAADSMLDEVTTMRDQAAEIDTQVKEQRTAALQKEQLALVDAADKRAADALQRLARNLGGALCHTGWTRAQGERWRETHGVTTTAWQPFPLPAGSERVGFIDHDLGKTYFIVAGKSLPKPWRPCAQRASALCTTLAEFDAAFYGICPNGDATQAIHASTFDDTAVAAVSVDFYGIPGCPTFGLSLGRSGSLFRKSQPLLRLTRATRDAHGIVTLAYSARRCCAARGGPGTHGQLFVGLPRVGLRGVRWVEDGFEVASDAVTSGVVVPAGTAAGRER